MPANISRKKPQAGPQRGRMALMSFLLRCFCCHHGCAWFVQVNDNQKYIGESKRQHQTTVRIPSRRGDIHDRNGRELALTAMVPLRMRSTSRQITGRPCALTGCLH